MAKQLQTANPLSSLSSMVTGLTKSMSSISGSLHSLGLDTPGSARTRLVTVQKGANDLAGASRQIADGVTMLVDQTKQMGAGLSQASAFLMAMGQNASEPSMAGFNLPAEVLNTDEFKKAAQIFISPDGHAARYFIQTNLNPFSTEAMDQLNEAIDAAHSAQPNTTLADAKISISGYPATLRDTRDYYQHDLRLIMIVTVAVVLLILIALLRAVVAPLYLVGSVILSYLSAVGIGVLVFQYLLGRELHWSVPGLAFVVLVAVGADYNMLLASRLRDEAPHGLRYGVIRTVRYTGGVITAAGLIFAASMFGPAVLEHRHGCAGRLRHRRRDPARHLRSAHHHGARDRNAAGPGRLVAGTPMGGKAVSRGPAGEERDRLRQGVTVTVNDLRRRWSRTSF